MNAKNARALADRLEAGGKFDPLQAFDYQGEPLDLAAHAHTMASGPGTSNSTPPRGYLVKGARWLGIDNREDFVAAFAAEVQFQEGDRRPPNRAETVAMLRRWARSKSITWKRKDDPDE